MIDVIERLQYAETRPLDADGKTQLWETLQDARAEITRLREAIRRLADQDATLSVAGGNVTVTVDATLTDADRKALEWAILALANSSGARVGVAMDNVIASQQLRKLLERLGPTGSE